ncbi:conserved protein, unknown function [Hepatocystis sp. ex Piliocolobus tephrosceles]|nr:conserved protein, unknown function [Hepatocystis sp. ex Piliocolobus tephrosceles]
MNLSIDSEFESNFFIKSFFESLSNFVRNVKIEIKDVFELLNYPCVYQNCKKKFSINENEDYKNVLETHVISKKDKKNIENFRLYQKELQTMLKNIKQFHEKYKLDIPLSFILENIIILHLINEYKIKNIVEKIKNHNIAMPVLNSDLPNYLIQAIDKEKEENNEYNEFYEKVKEGNSLSINNYAVQNMLKYTDIKINLSKLNMSNNERYVLDEFKYTPDKYVKETNEYITTKIKERTYSETEKDTGATTAHQISMIDATYKTKEKSLEDLYNISNDNEKHTPNKVNTNNNNNIIHKTEEETNPIENIGLSEETLKLLNLLPKKRKND